MTAKRNDQRTDGTDTPAKGKGHSWFATIYDPMSRAEERGFLGEMRKRLLGDIMGDVLEIGAGGPAPISRTTRPRFA